MNRVEETKGGPNCIEAVLIARAHLINDFQFQFE